MVQASSSDSPLVIPVILSGGVGSRLWPLSRELYPKQLHALVTEKSLLQETASRVSGERFSEPAIICNNEHRFIVAEHLRDCGIKPSAILLEPVGRNTAPAAAIAALLIAETNEDALILLLPSDHIIKDQDKFFGRNEYMNSVIFEGNSNLIGKNINIKIEQANQNSLFGKIEKNNMKAA